MILNDKKIIHLFGLLVFFGLLNIYSIDFCFSQNILSKQLTIEYKNTSIEAILKQIQTNYAVNFSYSKTLIDVNVKISIKAENETLNKILEKIFENRNVLFVEKANIIILQPKPQNIDKLIFKGQICDDEDKPLAYAAIMFKQSGKGVITDINGNFKVHLKKSDLHDTLIISSLGFEKKTVIISNIKNNSSIKILLLKKMIVLDEIKITNKKFKNKTKGNDGFFSLGSIYIDTHGQQNVLFIENEGNMKGKISAVNYYLSKNGNTAAPFRVRLYELDSISGKPGKDLLSEMIVAKPNVKSGWFSVNISEYNIQIPPNGFFAGIEGLYPGKNPNQNVSDSDENENNSRNETPNTISYGQQLGYSRAKGKNTWHYSMANTWFQLEKNNYNIMISVDLKISK